MFFIDGGAMEGDQDISNWMVKELEAISETEDGKRVRDNNQNWRWRKTG